MANSWASGANAPMVGASAAGRGAIEVTLAFLFSFIASWIVHRPYFDGTFILDEIYYIQEIGLIELGRSSWPAYLLRLHGGYLHLLWKLQFYIEWKVFGPHPEAFRLLTLFAHSIGATALFVLIRNYGGGLVAASLASLLWSAAACGGYENPFLSITSGEQAWCLAWFLFAMLCVTRCGGRYSRLFAALMAACALTSVFIWAIAWSLLPAITIQFFLLESPKKLERSARRWWIGAWTATFAIAGAFQTFVLRIVASSSGSPKPSLALFSWKTFDRLVQELAVALGNLVYWPASEPEQGMLLKILLMASLMAAAVLLPIRLRRLALVFFTIGLFYTLVLVLFRSNRDLFDGRHLFVPTLTWCVTLALLVDVFGASQRRWLALGPPLFALAMTPVFLFHQYKIALSARNLFDGYFVTTGESSAECQELLEALSDMGVSERRKLRLPDLPLVFPPHFQPDYYPVSAFVKAYFPSGLPGLEVVPIGKISDGDLDLAIAALRSQATKTANYWIDMLDEVVPDVRLLNWLSQSAEASGSIVQIPEFQLTYKRQGINIPVRLCLLYAFDSPLPFVEVNPSLNKEGLLVLVQRLEKCDSPRAKQWADSFKASLAPPPSSGA